MELGNQKGFLFPVDHGRLIRWFGDGEYFNALDLVSGYWQVELQPRYLGKIAFVIPSNM